MSRMRGMAAEALRQADAGPTAAHGRRIRLCIVAGGHWEAQRGGAQYQLKCLLDALAQRDEFETFYIAHAVPQRLERETYRIVPVGRLRRGGSLRLLTHLPSVYAALRALRPDVVYQRSLMPYVAACAFYCRRHGARFVFHAASEMDVIPPRLKGWSPSTAIERVRRRIEEFGLHRADVIVTQTRDQARLLEQNYGLAASAVVPNFHPAPGEERRERRGGRRRVVWVANFKPVKNPEQFVDLAEAFAHRTDVEFVMIGRPGDPKRYAALHERISRLPNLKFLGELPLERVNEEIAASDVLVNTSTLEGFPNTFIQAWLRGVPVVSTRVDPDGCLSRHGTGIVAGSAANLVPVLESLLADGERLRRLGEAARAYAHAHHLADRAEQLVELLAKQGGLAQGAQ